MTYRDVIWSASQTFTSSETPFLDAVLLLAESLGKPKEQVLAMLPEHAEHVPEAFEQMVARRQRGESIAHIVGRKEFYGRVFQVSGDVLSPRQDTETLVDAVLKKGDELVRFAIKDTSTDACKNFPIRVLDLCTGSGVVGISVAVERPEWKVSASDISRSALDIAKKNALCLLPAEKVTFIESDLFSYIEDVFDIIAANPPYVPHHHVDSVIAKGWTDPRESLDGGEDGMSFIREIIPQSTAYLSQYGVLLLEIDPLQADESTLLLQESGFRCIETWNDLAGRVRVIGATHG